MDNLKLETKLFIIGWIFISLLFSQPVIGQDFGKNRVRYKDFTWKIASTKHFDIYFHPGTEILAAKAAEFAEEAYRKVSQDFDFKVSRAIPLIIFPSHSDFQQTNVILEFIDRGVGGFAEIFKYRIVIPFTGSYAQFQHVVTHELVHIFTYDILYRDAFGAFFSSRMITPPPLWLMEGIAEYGAGKMDPEGEAVLQNAVIDNDLIPLKEMADFSSSPKVYLGYKQSASFVGYIAETYGPDKPALLIKKYRDSPNIETVVKSTLGQELPEVWEGWLRYAKRKYYPNVADKEPPETYGKKLINKISLGAVWSAGGDLMAVLTRHGYKGAGVSLIKVEDGVEVDKFGFDELEEVNMEGNPLDWSPDGRFIVLLVSKKAKDYFLIRDVPGEEATKRIPLEGLDSLSSPAWLGKRLVFAGTKAGKSSLYLFDPSTTTTLTQLTADTFTAYQPACSPDERQIAFVVENGEARDIYLLELDSIIPGTHEVGAPAAFRLPIRPLIQNGQQNVDPAWGPNGKRLYFASDIGGGYDIYEYNLESEQMMKLTNSLGGSRSPRVSRDGKRLAFTAYLEGEPVTYVSELEKLTREEVGRGLDYTAQSGKADELAKLTKQEASVDTSFELKDYKMHLTMDWAQGNIIYNTSQGFTGFTEIAVSDILGNHRFILLTDYLTTISNLADLNLVLRYLYLAKRPVVGVGLFNWRDLRFWDEDKELDNRRYGGFLYLAYPLDTFRRLEAEFISEFKGEEFLTGTDEIEVREEGADIVGLSYVKDTTRWGLLAPIDGARLVLRVEQSVPVFFKKRSFTNYILDVRKYIRLSARSALAFRIAGEISEGKDPDIFPLGGSWDMREVQYNKFWGNRVVIANLELRVPFIDRLDLAFPLPISLKGISGVGFFDLGGAWNESEKPRFWNDDKNHLGERFHSAIGLGTRLTLGFFPIRLDWAFPTDLKEIKSKSVFHFSLGYDF
ncbi:MAG: BamA/TamA family outer membrane protein [bacterium]